MKIDGMVISVSNDDIVENIRMRNLLFENDVSYSIGSTSITKTEKVGRTTSMTVEFFTLYRFNCENDAVEFKLRYM